MTQLSFEFAGAALEYLDLCVEEYRGLSTSQIGDSILEVLRGIAPGVSFFPEEVVEAAESIQAELSK